MTTLLKMMIVLCGVALLTAGKPCEAAQQDGPSRCPTTYENHNQIDYGPLKVHTVRGTSVIQIGGRTQPAAPPEACFTLFTEKNHTLVNTAKSASDGRFELRNVTPGRYRLIARANGFCTANVPLEVVKSSRQMQQIVVHFCPAGIDTCSYGELTATEKDVAKSATTSP